MRRFEKVATPAAAATVGAPLSVPAPGLVPIAIVTLPVNPVAVLPCASRAVTRTAGALATPAVALLGWTVNASCVAPAGVTLNVVLLAVLAPVADATSV